MSLGKSVRIWFSPSVLDRYLTIELVLPLVFGVCAFSSIGLAIGSLFDIVRQVAEAGLPIHVALRVLLLRMPEFVVYSFPMSMLLSTMMAYSRLTGDSELIAMRSVGISVYRIIVPALLLSLVVTGITFLFHELIVPQANAQASLVLEQAINQETLPVQRENILYQEYENVEQPDGETRNVLNRLFYAEEFDSGQMRGLTIIDRSQGELSQIITAKAATWNFAENKWDFYNGTIYLISPDGSFRNILRFEHQQLQLPRTPLDLAQQKRNASEMNIRELRHWIQQVRGSGDEQEVRKLKVSLQQKFALPFICIVFALVGSALGTRPQNTNKATSFGISIIIIFSYYLLSFITGALGVAEVLSPFLAGWLPNIFGLIAGIWLIRQSAK